MIQTYHSMVQNQVAGLYGAQKSQKLVFSLPNVAAASRFFRFND